MKQKIKYTLGTSLCIVFLPIGYIFASTQDDPLSDFRGDEERLIGAPQVIVKENNVREITIPGSTYSAGSSNGQQYIVKTESDGTKSYTVDIGNGVSSNIQCKNNECTGGTKEQNQAYSKISNSNEERYVYTSENVPGAKCTCVAGCDNTAESVAQKKYKCEVQSGLSGFQNMLGQIVKWFVYMALLLGVLVIVGLGIAWTLAGGDDIKAKMGLKSWLINVIVGFIILTFFAAILKFLAPWIFL